MEEQLLIDRVKEAIGEARVEAALFHTFQFDPNFFEQYVLPVFLPEKDFGNNEIQNAILWRSCQDELPSVTVYCDHHGKVGSSAPSLPYEVRELSFQGVFHPKTAFLLTDDGRLIGLVGSNNLTENGWCRNLEAVSVLELKNGSYFPDRLRFELYSYLNGVIDLLDPGNSTEGPNVARSVAEIKVIQHVGEAETTDHSSPRLFHATAASFSEALRELRKEHPDEEFEELEVLSPYFGSSTPVRTLKELFAPERIKVELPQEDDGTALIDEGLFQELSKEGVRWSAIKKPEGNEKVDRFPHAKLYRLVGQKHCFSIVGSVNLTDAAFRPFSKQRKGSGNLEAALIHMEERSSEQPPSALLEELSEDRLPASFKAERSETEQEERVQPPPLRFTLYWEASFMLYAFTESEGDEAREGRYRLEDPFEPIPLEPEEACITFDHVDLASLAQEPLIKVKDKVTERTFYFYPKQSGIEQRPLPAKLRLSDKELLDLWGELAEQEDGRARKYQEWIEKIVASRTNASRELVNEKGERKSTLNLMAAHLSGLIELEKALFDKEADADERERRIRYFLYTDNIDTLIGYRRLLMNMREEGQLLPAFHWLLLRIVKMNFYERMEAAGFEDPDLKLLNDVQLRGLEWELNGPASELQAEGLEEHVQWVEEQLMKDRSKEKPEG